MQMSKRVLVGYATNLGSSVKVAEKIAEVLRERGFEADVRSLKESAAIRGYDAAVLGSAINGGVWLPEALAYLQSNRESLSKISVAVFSVHGMALGDSEKETTRRLSYLDKVRQVIDPVAEGFFAGKMQKMNWLQAQAFKFFGGTVVVGDGRDYEKIAAWANELEI